MYITVDIYILYHILVKLDQTGPQPVLEISASPRTEDRTFKRTGKTGTTDLVRSSVLAGPEDWTFKHYAQVLIGLILTSYHSNL
jgi:hypothetical protein